MGRFGTLVGWCLRIGIATTCRQAQRMLVIGAVEIAAAVRKCEQYRAMQTGYRDLQQQSDRSKDLTETEQITRTRWRRTPLSPLINAHNLIRSTSSGVSRSFVRSYSLVVRGLSCATISWACSIAPPLAR